MKYPPSIEITEVGPRDGLQNQAAVISTETKIAFVEALSKTGLSRIEVSSFVNPTWVPQLADASEVFEKMERVQDVRYTAIVPNEQGWIRAVEAGIDEIALITAASESFCVRNINTSIEGSIDRMKPVVEAAKAAGVRIRGYVSCVVACPYEGEIDPEQVRNIVKQLISVGVEDISLGETIGVAVPNDISRLYDALDGVLAPNNSILHLHDTRGTALACASEAMQLGVCRFDTSTGGIGGCPYAPGAAGNLATEDLLYFAKRMGIHTGVDLDLLLCALRVVEDSLDSPPTSRVYRASSCQEPRS